MIHTDEHKRYCPYCEGMRDFRQVINEKPNEFLDETCDFREPYIYYECVVCGEEVR
jgi:hypothetical protein